MFTGSKNDYNTENCKEYKNVKVEIICKDMHTVRTVEEVYVDMFTEDFVMVKMSNKYFIGANSAGDKVYLVNDDGSKILSNKGE